MAQIQAVYSMSLKDAKGSRATIPLYITVDDTQALSDILAGFDTFSENFDSLTEAQIVGHSLTIVPPVALTWKVAPVANSDVEEGALFSFSMSNLPSKSYGIEIPAFLQSKFTGNEVNTSDVLVADLITALTNNPDYPVYNNLWSSTLLSPPRRAYKSFRKHNRKAR